ncbi:MAG: RNase adapter RapZ [Candidatus Melainabacteria bacterium]|nr:RNase adapter RapZ [Candidatus Melainabacteria bacterium]
MDRSDTQNVETDKTPLAVEVVSFGFKNGSPPPANIVLDVRFLKNPYWVEELRPLTGLDAPVRKYVLDQELAQDVLDNLVKLVEHTAPAMLQAKVNTFTIALGCTGGQHRSPAMVEALRERVCSRFADYEVSSSHRELIRMKQEAEANFASEDGDSSIQSASQEDNYPESHDSSDSNDGAKKRSKSDASAVMSKGSSN